MTNVEETTLAWELAGCASGYLPPHFCTFLWAKLGAGEDKSAIEDLLGFYVEYEHAVPLSLAARIQVWIDCYRGSDSELPLRSLLGRLRVTVESCGELPI